MRVVVLGGCGNFGARIVRALRGDPAVDLLVAGRRLVPASGAEDVPGVVIDIGAPDFAQRLRAQSPDLVIHCVGPYQGQDYSVASAALAAGAHYLDLADGRHFIAEFAAQMNERAIKVGSGGDRRGEHVTRAVIGRSRGAASRAVFTRIN